MRMSDASVRWWDGFSIELTKFPELLQVFRHNNPDTLKIEHDAAIVIENDFSCNRLRQFIEAVCKWGGRRGPSVLKRVKKNTESNLVTTFRYAYETARGGEVKSVVRALEVIQSLDGLGVALHPNTLNF